MGIMQLIILIVVGLVAGLLSGAFGIGGAMELLKSRNCEQENCTYFIAHFFIGEYFGSNISLNIPDRMLRKLFGGLLILIALNMIFSK